MVRLIRLASVIVVLVSAVLVVANVGAAAAESMREIVHIQ
jgi:hypothetical protein